MWRLPGGLLVCAVLVWGCQFEVEEIFSATDLPHTENALYGTDGRFFLVGGVGASNIFEIVPGHGGYEAQVLQPGRGGTGLARDCFFSGLALDGQLLYAACNSGVLTGSTLLRLDLGEPAGSATRLVRSPYRFGRGSLLNGMAVDRRGVLYVSDSSSILFGRPEVYRVTVRDYETMEVDVEPFITSLSESGLRWKPDMPNGVQIVPSPWQPEVDLLYYVRGPDLYRMELTREGYRGLVRVYHCEGQRNIDDFAVQGPYLALASFRPPGLMWRDRLDAQVILAELDEDGVTAEYPVELDFAPSSIAFREESMFGPRSLMVTSFIDGGLYRITLSPLE